MRSINNCRDEVILGAHIKVVVCAMKDVSGKTKMNMYINKL